MEKQSDPLPKVQKFCFCFELRPTIELYITLEYIVWILLLLSAVNLEIDCVENTNLKDFEEVLKNDLYYNVIFGPPESVLHNNARGKIFFNLMINLQIFPFVLSLHNFSQHNSCDSFSTIFYIHTVLINWSF